MPVFNATENALPFSTVQVIISKKIRVTDEIKDFIALLTILRKRTTFVTNCSLQLDLWSCSDLLVCSQSIFCCYAIPDASLG